MKRVILKEKSPDFADEKKPTSQSRLCDAPGCMAESEHRAPKDRSLSEYYHFCFDHVRAYNQTWDFFDGMSSHDIEDHLRSSMMGDRPTWTYSSRPDMEESLRAKAFQWRGNQGDTDTCSEEETPRSHRPSEKTPETEALSVLGLEPPVTLDEIKSQYKALAKEHHPDRNPGKPEAEELLKQINMAYTVLKVAYERYEKVINK